MVGAGGAGFPTHIKLEAAVHTVIANGAECEPLLTNDRFNMVHHPHKIIEGLNLLADSTGARRKVIAVKKKYTDARKSLEKCANSCEIFTLPDYYPVGDEVEIVKLVTGDTIPEGGLPLHVGVVVNNIETLMNITDARQGKPVTHRYITVCGEIKNPQALKTPIGAKIKDIVEKCGGSATASPVYYIGGPMMGTIVAEDEPVAKTTTGIFVLNQEHPLIQKRALRMEHILRQAQSACTDCRLCTDACPRFLLGHDIEPHKIMRTVSLTLEGKTREMMSAYLCCFCGVCEYACPMWLSPKRVYEKTLDFLKEINIDFNNRQRELLSHPMRQFRRIPSERLLNRLGLAKYDVNMTYHESDWHPSEVHIPLKQHIGLPAEPIITKGDKVLRGQVIAEIPPGKLSAKVHASIDGVVKYVNRHKVVITAP